VMEILLLILIPLSAGLIIQLIGNVPDKIYRLILALSGAFVMGMCFLHLLPETYLALQSLANSGAMLAGGAVILGILLQIGLEWLTGGIEHGHSHIHTDKKGVVPQGLVIGLCVHAFIEGLPLASFHSHEHHFLLSILVHKFPVALILVMVLKSLGVSNLKSWLYLLLFAGMAPLGILLSTFIAEFVSSIELSMLLISGLVIGVLLHIGTTILFESNEGHTYNISKLAVIIIGFILAAVTSM